MAAEGVLNNMDTIQDLTQAFSRFEGVVETKLDEIKEELKTLHERVDKRDAENQDLIKRVTTLETTQAVLKWAIGVSLTIGVIVVTWYVGVK